MKKEIMIVNLGGVIKHLWVAVNRCFYDIYQRHIRIRRTCNQIVQIFNVCANMLAMMIKYGVTADVWRQRIRRIRQRELR